MLKTGITADINFPSHRFGRFTNVTGRKQLTSVSWPEEERGLENTLNYKRLVDTQYQKYNDVIGICNAECRRCCTLKQHTNIQGKQEMKDTHVHVNESYVTKYRKLSVS